MKRYHNNFPESLIGMDFKTFEESPHSIFGISKNLELIYFNPAWFEFAKQNNGEPGISEKFGIGTLILDAISGSLKDFYHEVYSKIFITQLVWKQEYECSSKNLKRMFLQTIYPIKGGEMLMVLNSLKTEIKGGINITKGNVTIKDYLQPTGLITQCSNCRRTQRGNSSEIWDWVPEWVEEIPNNTSHSICPICYDYYGKS